MKHIYAVLLITLTITVGFGQEEVGPITRYNFPVKNSGAVKKITRASNNTIDSTFTYLPDTLQLPLFDDFSISHFQEYDAGFTDPGVTETIYYKLLDAVTNQPFPATARFTNQITYRTTVNTQDNTSTNTNFTPTSVKYGNFTAFPINYTTTNAYPPYLIIDTVSFPNPPDTIWLEPEIYQDSARIFTAKLNDPQSFWLDKNVFHNYTMAIKPWSLGVATFDGLNENGYPYQFNSTINGIGDYLTSKYINMSGVSPSDSVYLSFIVQRGGYGDVPETNDSLVLEFYNSISEDWERIWAYQGGTNITAWKVVNLKVIKSDYFTEGFRIRFKNYAGLSGSLDHFHLDYVNLRANGGYQDSIFEDFAWSYPVGSLIKDYTSVPWEHWQNNSAGKMNNQTKVVVSNVFPIAKNPAISQVRVKNPVTGVTSTLTMNNATITQNPGTADYLPFSTPVSFHDFTAVNQFDPAIAGPEVTFDVKGIATIQEPTYLPNDTCYTTQHFADYYSYDDGSAEKAYGLISAQARLAIKYTAYESDTLLGVRMHFVPSVKDVSDKLFLLTVWGDNNGVPGAVLYEDNFFNTRNPVYEDGYNQFKDYYFKDFQRLLVPQTFYIGWRQIDNERLNIGLDMNTNSRTKTFYSINGGASWSNSSTEASVMIRPVFNTRANYDLSVGKNTADFSFEVFPNPTNGKFAIDWRNNEEFPGAVCVDVQGRIIGKIEKSAAELSFDLSDKPSGIYFVQLDGVSSVVKKVVKQ